VHINRFGDPVSRPAVGDLILFNWRFPQDTNGGTIAIVTGVWEPPNYHSGIDYTFELLEPTGKKLIYDVFRNGTKPTVLSRCKTRFKNGRVKP
jgi:hypothetical protein